MMELDIVRNGNGVTPVVEVNAEAEALREQLLIEHNRTLSTLADFKNYRRRMEREGNKIADTGKREFVLPLLDIVDDLEKALQSQDKQETSSLQGVRIIHQKFLALLAAQGVRPFESIGVPFDHQRHEAVSMANDEEGESGTIVEEFRRGYHWNSDLLRTAQVRVVGW